VLTSEKIEEPSKLKKNKETYVKTGRAL